MHISGGDPNAAYGSEHQEWEDELHQMVAEHFDRVVLHMASYKSCIVNDWLQEKLPLTKVK